MWWQRAHLGAGRRPFALPRTCVRAYSRPACPELRILFCGSDNFSASSLEGLASARASKQLPITSLDVLCRPPKRIGRGLKTVREVPIVETAKTLGLPVHKIDTFKEWSLPSAADINMIIAVSFGLLIPRRIIEAAQYGGLNVHPSLLPDFRGAAPIEHALLEGCERTGVSLQTLHPDRFDHGKVLRQAEYEIGRLPFLQKPECSVSSIKSRLAEKGADLLIKSLESGDFLEPVCEVRNVDSQSGILHKAPKITTEDSHLDWKGWRNDQVLTRQWVLGPLWSTLVRTTANGIFETRVKWTGGFTTQDKASVMGSNNHADSSKPAFDLSSGAGSLSFPTMDGAVSIERFTIAGKSEMSAKQAWDHLKIKEQDTIDFR